METNPPRNLFLCRLAEKHRVILLGGMAVIAYGFSRRTKDYDAWLEPFASAEEWAQHLLETVAEYPEAYIWSLADQRRLSSDEVAVEIETYGVLRIGGLNLPVDVFRKPNELEIADFDRVWASSKKLEEGFGLPHELDLYVTKANTGREHDFKDQIFLEGRVKERFRERLPVCDFAEAKGMLDRFLDPEVLQYGLDNPDAAVRDLVLGYLHEFESEGDPYSRDILAAWKARSS